MDLFENKVGRPSNEIKRKRKIFIVSTVVMFVTIILGGYYALKNVDFSGLEGASAKRESIIDQRDAVLTVAKAYKEQGKQIQYDSYRKNLNCTPEDATSKHVCYTVCSGLVYMSYKQALNMELPKDVNGLLAGKVAKRGIRKIKPKVIFSAETSTSKTAKAEFVKFITDKEKLKEVRKGDILVWSGHTMLVESIGENSINVIHATGVDSKDTTQDDGDSGRYDTKNQKESIEPSGAIHEKTITENNIKNADKIVIIRYIYEKRNITPASETRANYENIKITKIIIDVKDQTFTTKGSELTYRIRIRNESENTKYNDIKVLENIDTSLVELKGANLNISYLDSGIKKKVKNNSSLKGEKKISWTIPELLPGRYVTLEYTVKVKSNIYKKSKYNKSIYNKDNKIIVSTGKVGDIATSKIETLVGKRLTKNQTQELSKCIADYKTCFQKYKTTEEVDIINLTSGKKFVDTLYKASLDINVGLSSIKTLGNSITYNRKKSEFELNSSIEKYLYSNFYGLRIEDYKPNDTGTNKFFKEYRYTARAHAAWGDKVSRELKERARTINSSMLREGDIVITFADLECEKKTSEKTCCYKVSDKKNCFNEEPKDRSEKVYIYLNETFNVEGTKKFDKGLHRYIKDKTTDTASFETIKEGEDLDKFLRDLVGDNYIILRPYK